MNDNMRIKCTTMSFELNIHLNKKMYFPSLNYGSIYLCQLGDAAQLVHVRVEFFCKVLLQNKNVSPNERCHLHANQSNYKMLSGNLQILCQKFEKIKEVASPK